MKHGQLIPTPEHQITRSVAGPGEVYGGRWCESCAHAHGPAYICLAYTPEIIEQMVPPASHWLSREDVDDYMMKLLDGGDIS